MSNPELARPGRRVDEQDETVRAISDTVLDIKASVGQHTELLKRHTEVLIQHAELLTEILRRLEAR